MVTGPLAGRPITQHLADPAGVSALHVHRDLHVWTWASAVAIAGELRRDLQASPRTRLIVDGSGTAVPVLQALARAPLDWSRVDVGLTDERWLHPDDPDSKAALVRRHLLRDHAAPARFETLTSAGRRIEDALAMANAHAQQAPNVAVVTLGDDGHLAGLFADAPDYARVVTSRQAYASFDAPTSASATPWSRRLTATPWGLARARLVVLLLHGPTQRALFEAAAAGESEGASPLVALHHAGAAIQAHWHP